MSRSAVLIALLVACGCSRNVPTVISDPATPSKPVQHTEISGLSSYALGEPIVKNNYAIVPVVLREGKPPQSSDYMSLNEAREKGLVRITELSEGQEVDSLEVSNLGSKPLLLLSGQLLLGGKQDRIVAKDTVVPAGATMPVPVFCVEHDRWTGPDNKFRPSADLAPQSVRAKAIAGNQEQVWASVGAYNAKAGASAEVSSVRGGLEKAQIHDSVQRETTDLKAALAKEQNVVGLVYVVNGNVEDLELFANPETFASSLDGILASFAADAAVRPQSRQGPPDLAAVSGFVNDSIRADRQETQVDRASASWKVAGRDVVGQEATTSTVTGPVASDSAKPGFIHGSYTRKQ